jgi:outer membrane protein assembly complex protein YaeT
LRKRPSAGRIGICLALACLRAGPGLAQEPVQAVDGMAVRAVEIQGLETISESFVRRLLRTRVGQSFSQSQLQEDVRALLRTRKFLNVTATTRVEEGQAVVVFLVQEKPEIVSIELEGNKRFKDDELFREMTITPRTPIDRYEINRSLDNLVRKYREKGHYYVQITLDEELLERERRVLFRIVEGPRVRVRRIVLEGNRSFPELTLRTRIRTQTYFWLLSEGALDPEQVERDALEIQGFYRSEGFLDARVGYRLEFEGVERTDLTLVFVIEEGPRYRVHEIRFEGPQTFDPDTLRAAMQLSPGALAREEVLREDLRRLQDKYGQIGFVEARIDSEYQFLEEPGLVNILIRVVENQRSRFGRITIRGNVRTRDEVIRRELRFYPGEDYDTVRARRAERRLLDTGLFSKATITPLPDVEGFREALVEVEEADAVRFLFGVGLSTDSGLIGSLTVDHRNFDLFDFPRTFGELLRGQAFRGAGQRLRISLEPGTEVSRFRLDFTEPWLLGRPLRLDTSLFLFQRDRGPYDETRLGFIPALSHRFETGLLDGWALEGALRFELIEIDDVDGLAAKAIREVRGSSALTSVKVSIVRDTTDSRLVPTEGYRFSLSWEQAGLLGGDYDFGKPTASIVWYKTLHTDALDRKGVLALRADAGWIVGDAPVFERFYGGGFGSMRGFAFRGISPRAGIKNDRVGGDFIVLTGAEYSFPLYARIVRGVVFLDMGTVEKDFTISGWRASVGMGLRVNLDFLFGPVPLVFDFGFPVLREDGDDDQIFTFSVGASF